MMVEHGPSAFAVVCPCGELPAQYSCSSAVRQICGGCKGALQLMFGPDWIWQRPALPGLPGPAGRPHHGPQGYVPGATPRRCTGPGALLRSEPAEGSCFAFLSATSTPGRSPYPDRYPPPEASRTARSNVDGQQAVLARGPQASPAGTGLRHPIARHSLREGRGRPLGQLSSSLKLLACTLWPWLCKEHWGRMAGMHVNTRAAHRETHACACPGKAPSLGRAPCKGGGVAKRPLPAPPRFPPSSPPHAALPHAPAHRAVPGPIPEGQLSCGAGRSGRGGWGRAARNT